MLHPKSYSVDSEMFLSAGDYGSGNEEFRARATNASTEETKGINNEDDICEDERSNSKDETTEVELEAGRGSRECLMETAHQVIFPEYPRYGVIGSNEPMSLNLFYKPSNNQQRNMKDFRKQKFDFYETYEKNITTEHGIIKSATPLPGLGYLCRGFRTADIYKVDPNLPKRFQNPDLFHGYGCEREENPLFRTTTSEYGKFAPTVHDVPYEYYGLKNTFTKHLSSTGMPKNRSLNIK